jgi:eukaryotic-like serine/threonine-protein kinase
MSTSTLRHCTRCGKDYPADAAFCPEDGAPLAAADPAEPGPKTGVILDERYELEELIGAGGLGEIYRARHLRMNRAFAVKLLQQNMVKRPDFIGRFEREARALSRLTHPCCVAVTDYGISEEHGPYIVMELVEGVPLSAYTRGQGLPLGEAVELIMGVLAGLDHAHKQGIVHRDIKPDNIMIVEQPLGPGQRMPKILDFGLAKIRAGFNAPAGQTLTETGFIIGTPHYLPPERVTNPSADDPRSDLYAVGVILFELCCGRRPFEAAETPRVVEMHLSAAPPGPRELRPDLPLPLELAILRALQKQPQARFVSALEFRQALEQVSIPEALAGLRPSDPRPASRPTAARAPATRPPESSPGPRAGRRPLLLVGGLVVLLAGLIATAVVLLRRTPAPPETAVPVVVPERPVPPRPRPAARPPATRAVAAVPAATRPASTPAAIQASEDDVDDEEPPSAAQASSSLPPELLRTYKVWRNKRTRQQAVRQFSGYLTTHRSDFVSHIFVGRLYLYSLWSTDGLKLVQRGLAAKPDLKLDPETVFGLAFAYRGAAQSAARRLIDAYASGEAPRIQLAAAVITRNGQIRQNLLAEARRRANSDALSLALLRLAEARGCEAQRRALQALPGHDSPYVKIMLHLLRSNRCLGGDARSLLR